MDILKELMPQTEQVEVVKLQSESVTVGFENNRLKSSQSEETTGTAVRIIKDGKLGFSASSTAGADEKLVRNVLESAAYGDEISLSFPEDKHLKDVLNYDKVIAELPIPKMVEMGQKIIDTLLESDPELQVNVNLVRGTRKFGLKNQAGFDNTYQKSPLSIEFEIFRIEGDDVFIIWDATATTVWQEDYLAPARRAGDLFESGRKIVKMKSGRMPVLFAPKGTAVLAVPLLEGLNGKNVYTDISPMKEKVGEGLFDPKLTIVDNPTIDGRYNSAPFDDEGVASMRNVLIEDGVLKGFYYDLKTASLSGVDPTGNGARGLFNPPSPSTSNFIIEPGDTSLQEMIAGIDQGLLVQEALGVGQGNTVSGAFSNTLSLAYLIDKGKIVGRVKDVSIAGNIYDVLTNIAAISRENEWIYYKYCLPYILIDDMNVVAKQ
jgi:PmbA protein